MAAPDFAAQNFYVETAASPIASTQSPFDKYVESAQIVLDAFTSFTGFLVAYLLEASFSVGSIARHSLFEVSAEAACFALLVVSLLARDGAYRSDSGLLQIRETERAIRVSTQSLVLLWFMSLLLHLQYSALVFLVSGFLMPVYFMLQRQLFFQAVTQLRGKFGCDLPVLVYGTGDAGRAVVSALLASPRAGLRPVAVVDDSGLQHRGNLPAMGYLGRSSIPIINGILTPDVLRSRGVKVLLIASTSISPERIAAAKDAARIAGISVAFLSSPPIEEEQFSKGIEIDGLQFSFQPDACDRRLYALFKRLIDIVLSSVLLVCLSPVLFAIAILIRLDSPGPALFIQERAGLNGALFRMFKFRTMYASSPKYELSPTSSGDWRITCIGRVLRRTGLDELPQLINVFLGDMSLVGPRPEMPFVVERYTQTQLRRLDVIPGMTGMWQLSADRAFPIHQNIQYDFYYIRNRTLAMDIAILVHTLVFAMCGGI